MSLLGGIGDFLGLSGNSGSNIPSPQTYNTDEATNNAIVGEEQQANQSTGQIAQGLLGGTNNTGSTVTSGQIQRQQTELGGPNSNNSAVSSAIAAKQQNAYNQQYAQTQAQANVTAPALKMQMMGQAENALYQQDQTNYQAAQMQLQSNLNSVAIRNNAISSLFGGLGAAAGLAFGGIGGAAAGAKIGGAVGNGST